MNQIGTLSVEITEIMEKHNPLDELYKTEGKGIYTLNMLYDFWLIYAYQNDLIRDGYIYPDVTVHNLLYKLYNMYGASEMGFLLTTFLRMLGSQLDFSKNINVNVKDQADKLRTMRLGYQIK